MSFTWISVEAKTGRPIADLPGLVCDTTSAEIGQVTTTTASLPLRKAPVNWERAILPVGVFLVQIDTEKNVPVWGGMVTRAPRTEGDAVSLSLASGEWYLGCRYVRDITYTQVGQNALVTDLISRYITDGSNGGIPLRVLALDGVGPARTREYAAADNKTVLSVMQELSGVLGGPEWTFTWEMAADQSTITPVLQVGARIGAPVTPGLGPSATFSMPGSVLQIQQDGDYASGKGANDIVATSTASGSDTIESDHVVVSDPNRPTVEFRWSPSTSISDKGTLDDHAAARAPQMANGSQAVSFSAVIRDGVRLGSDWSIGDDVGYDITAPAFPNGLAGVARATGWQIDRGNPDTITPIFPELTDD